MKAMTSQYRCPVFVLIFSARCFRKAVHSSPMPPVVLKTRGVKVAFSTFITRWLYAFFFSFSWDLYICFRLLFLFDGACGCSTLISVNALSSGVQKPMALMSNLAPSEMFAPALSCSPVMLMSGGSSLTSLQGCSSSFAIVSLYRWVVPWSYKSSLFTYQAVVDIECFTAFTCLRSVKGRKCQIVSKGNCIAEFLFI